MTFGSTTAAMLMASFLKAVDLPQFDPSQTADSHEQSSSGYGRCYQIDPKGDKRRNRYRPGHDGRALPRGELR